jgi:hypothetical protein
MAKISVFQRREKVNRSHPVGTIRSLDGEGGFAVQ